MAGCLKFDRNLFNFDQGIFYVWLGSVFLCVPRPLIALILFISALFTFGLVALHLARAVLNFAQDIIYFRLGWLTFLV